MLFTLWDTHEMKAVVFTLVDTHEMKAVVGLCCLPCGIHMK